MTDKKREKDDKTDKTEVDSKYRLIQVAAKRARQLQNGARPQVNTETTKPTKLAMEEVKAGKVEWSIVEKKRADIETATEVPQRPAPEAAEKPEKKSKLRTASDALDGNVPKSIHGSKAPDQSHETHEDDDNDDIDENDETDE